MDYIFLQHYWWFIISLLGALLVFLLFVQGGQSLLFSLGKTEEERIMLTNSTGRKWEFTFTTLVTFGGAFFASFPLFYSTSFGGAYWVWYLILLCFVIQAVSYEYQSKHGSILSKKTYRIFLFINGLFGPILLGTAVGTFFNGAMFSIDKERMILGGVMSQWETSWHGLEAVLNPWNLVLGLALFFLARVTALLYFRNNIDDSVMVRRFRKRLFPNAIVFLVLFVVFLIRLLLQKGYAVDPNTGLVFLESYKYLTNLLQMPLVLILLLLGILLVLYGIGRTLLKKEYNKGIWFEGIGVVMVVLTLFLIAGWNNTSYYPSLVDMQSSLTIYNSSSSPNTLKLMFWVSLLVPFVLAYIFYAWRALDLDKINKKELSDGELKY